MLERSALGRSGHLGAVYDCRTDSFQVSHKSNGKSPFLCNVLPCLYIRLQGDSIFKEKLDAESIYETDLGDVDIDIVMSDSLDDKFDKLDVEAELSVSVLAGMIKLSGHAKYLDEKKSTKKAKTLSLIYKLTTKDQGDDPNGNKMALDYTAFDHTARWHP